MMRKEVAKLILKIRCVMDKSMGSVLHSDWKFAVGLLFVVALALPTNVFSQQPDRDRDRESESDEQDITRRSFNLRMLQIMAKQKRPRKYSPQLALAQVQEDFTHIQLVNKKLGLLALGNRDLDLKFVRKATTEINKRAERLKENLALPASAETTESFKYTVENASQLKAPIVALARLILDFTDNPYFKEAAVLETQQANKARRDLENIIALSERIRHLSGKLGAGGFVP